MCWRDRREVKGLCASMMIFHFEQTSWASQREGGIDLHSSNHNTSTFTQVYFLAFYQDFINYFRWQIDLLLFGPSSLLSEGKPGCVCVCASLSRRMVMCIRAGVVCFGGIICHLASKYSGHMVRKQMSLLRPGQCQVPTNDVRNSPHCICPNKQRRLFKPPLPVTLHLSAARLCSCW